MNETKGEKHPWAEYIFVNLEFKSPGGVKATLVAMAEDKSYTWLTLLWWAKTLNEGEDDDKQEKGRKKKNFQVFWACANDV